MARRIRVSGEQEDFVRSLAGIGAENQSDAAFDSMAEAMAFAALYGHSKSHRVKLATISKKVDSIRAEYIQSDAVEILALLECKGLRALTDENSDEGVDIFEEYANGGLELLKVLLQTKSIGSIRVNYLIAELGSEKETEEESLSGDDCIY